MVNKDIQ